MIVNTTKEYEAFLLDIWRELEAKETPYRFGYSLEVGGLLRPTLRLSVASKRSGRAVFADINHYETKEAIIDHFRALTARLIAAENKIGAQIN